MFELDAKIHRHQSFTIVWFEIVSHRRQFDNWHNNYCEYFFFSLVFHCAMTRASQFLASNLDWWMTNIRRRRRQLLWLSLVCNDHITLAENGVVSLCNSLATIQSTMQSLSSSRWHCVLLVPAKKKTLINSIIHQIFALAKICRSFFSFCNVHFHFRIETIGHLICNPWRGRENTLLAI